MKNIKIASILLLASTVFLKFSSMFRDLVISGLYGDSYQADAYFSAMVIPNAIILFMLTGMKDAFLPSYYKYDSLGKGYAHLTNIVKGTFWISLLISILGVLVSPLLIELLYPDFAKYDQGTEIAVWTAGIYFLSIFIVGINAVYEGYFDAQKKFSFSTFSQTIVSLSTIVFALLWHERYGIYSVAIGYFIGTFLSFLIKVVYLTPQRFLHWRQKSDWKEISLFYKIFLPVGITIAVGQINLMVNMLFASRMGEGVVSNLNYAFRLVTIPQALFGVTIATIIYPSLAKARSTSDMNQFNRGIEKGLTYMFLMIAPSVAGMMILMEPLVRIVYERGAFTEETTLLTSQYALYYMGSVLFYSIQAVVAKGFYTLEKGSSFMRIGLFSILLNIVSNYIFSIWMGPEGLALSASLVGMIYSCLTFTTLHRIAGGFQLKYLGSEYLKITVATSVMVVILLLLKANIMVAVNNDWIVILIMAIIGAALYFVMLRLTKSSAMQEIWQFRRKK